MDYEKAYKEALERARKELKQDLHESGVWAIQRIFPELKESEDERTRKEIVEFIRSQIEDGNSAGWDRWIAYLEKQKEKKPATIEQVNEKFLSSDTLKSAKENKYIRAQLLWELMHNGIITEVDYLYLTDDKRKPWTAEEYRIAYQKGFEMSEQLKQIEQKVVENPFDANETMKKIGLMRVSLK